LKLLVLKHGIAVYQEAEEVAKQEKTILIAVLANMETTLNQVKARKYKDGAGKYGD
jgi:hypothetical protein